MDSGWRYTKNREILHNEQFGWIPHCVPYRERERSRIITDDGIYVTNGSKIPTFVRTEASYMLDRNNSDRKGDPDNGGNLQLRKATFTNRHRGCHMVGSIGREYKGKLCISQVRNGDEGPWIDISRPDPLTDVHLDNVGASLVNRALPTLPAASLGQTLAELRRGLPRASLLTFRRLKGMDRDAADDFLNFQFGWKPLLQDIHASIESLREKDAKLAQLYRDNGKPVRREVRLPTQVSTETIVTGGIQWYNSGVPGFGPWLGTYGLGAGRMTITTTVDTWFSGCFVYHLPLGDDSLSKWKRFNAEADYLLGLSVTPELLWELAPWSWLVDWFSNTGDVISNVTRLGSDKLVMRYGYVMKRVRKKYELTGQIVPGGTTISFTGDNRVNQTWEYDQMYRRRANPYGFGVTWESLSKTQLAILAALGMTRRPGS